MLIKGILTVTIIIVAIVTMKNFGTIKEQALKEEGNKKRKSSRYGERKSNRRVRSLQPDERYLEVKKNSRNLMGISFFGCIVVIIIFLFYYGII
jgi:hypothetical protein